MSLSSSAMGSNALAICMVLSIFASLSRAQSTLDPASCISGSGITAFPNCKYLYDTISKCAGPSVASGAPFVACYCNQDFFNSIFQCESEERLCLGSPNVDADFQTPISDWHKTCDAKITFTATTPPVSSITVAFNRDACVVANSACASGLYEEDQCSRSYGTTGANWNSCFCQPKIISLDYACEFAGNISCQGTTADLTNLDVWPCPNAQTVLGTIVPKSGNTNVTSPASQSASTTPRSLTTGAGSVGTSVGTYVTSSFSITKPALPSSSPASPSALSTQSSMGTAVSRPSLVARGACWGMLVMTLLLAK